MAIKLDAPYTKSELAEFIATNNPSLDKIGQKLSDGYYLLESWEYIDTNGEVQTDTDLKNEYIRAVRGQLMSLPSTITSTHNIAYTDGTNSGYAMQILNVTSNNQSEQLKVLTSEETPKISSSIEIGSTFYTTQAIGYILCKPKIEIKDTVNFNSLEEVYIYSGSHTTIYKIDIPKNPVANSFKLILLGNNLVELTTDFWAHWRESGMPKTIVVPHSMYSKYTDAYDSRDFTDYNTLSSSDLKWYDAFFNAIVDIPSCTNLESMYPMYPCGCPTRYEEITGGDILTKYNTVTSSSVLSVVSSIACVYGVVQKLLSNGTWANTDEISVPFVEVVAPKSTLANMDIYSEETGSEVLEHIYVLSTGACTYRPIITSNYKAINTNKEDYCRAMQMEIEHVGGADYWLQTYSADEADMTPINTSSTTICTFTHEGKQYRLLGTAYIYNDIFHNSVST